jgi:hypothetical protein
MVVAELVLSRFGLPFSPLTHDRGGCATNLVAHPPPRDRRVFSIFGLDFVVLTGM